MVPHRSTNRARRCLTSLSRREAVLSSLYGRSCHKQCHQSIHTLPNTKNLRPRPVDLLSPLPFLDMSTFCTSDVPYLSNLFFQDFRHAHCFLVNPSHILPRRGQSHHLDTEQALTHTHTLQGSWCPLSWSLCVSIMKLAVGIGTHNSSSLYTRNLVLCFLSLKVYGCTIVFGAQKSQSSVER